ncbi:hypothetical protein [Athalassotoga sp.]|uniref:hypothetical protein n=1 Tax=Athalassotoga sp. TaxID=2022597 RepID=UPI003D02DA5E
MLDKYLYIRSHALQRSIEREIGLDNLKSLLESKESRATFQRNGRIRIENDEIVAIIQIEGDDLVLITAFKNS